MLVVCSFAAETLPEIRPERFRGAEVLLSNYPDPAGQLRPYEARILCRETDIRFVQQQCLLTEMLRKWYNHPNRVSWEQPQDVPEAEPLL